MTPRILKLIYRLQWANPNGNRVSANASLPASFRAGDFEASLVDGDWVFTPRVDFYSEEFARVTLEPMLRDWETEWDLLHRLRFSLKFVDCLWEQPERTESDVVEVSAKIGIREVSLNGSATWCLSNYPAAPSFSLRNTALAARLLARWHEIEDGRNTLLAGAYWFATTFESEFGGSRKAAAKNLCVDFPVLSTLGRLSTQNDPAESRKNKGPLIPLTEAEKTWLKQVIQKLMVRAVEVGSYHPHSTQITMNDLPRL
jgi:hypothetical protein